jgi:hypothetical protein
MESLPVYYGSALTEAALDSIDLEGIGHLLAMTSNDEVNSLTALHFSEVFGSSSVYQLPTEQAAKSSDKVVPRYLRGQFLFDQDANYWTLTARFDAGADIKTTNLTEAFDYQTFRQRYPDAIPLFLIGERGRLTVFTTTGPTDPPPGQRVVAIV